MTFCGRPTVSLALCLAVAVLLSATGCTNPMLTKQTTVKPPAEKPDFSKLRPGAECRVELSVVDKRGGPSHVAYTGTVSRVESDEVTLTDATRESGNEYGTPVEGRTPLANKSFINRGATDREKVGTISIPAAEISSIKPLDEAPRTAAEEREAHVMSKQYNRFISE
jgi:hypothetical protein